MKFLGLDVIQSLVNFFQTLKESLSLDYLLYIFLGLEILTIAIFSIVSHCTYELKLTRAVDKINGYLYEKQYINESNLIEFNRMMKRVPKTLRYHWQQYMLNREKAPSEYMSIENCIDRPLKSSSFETSIKVANYLSLIYACLAFVLGCGWATNLESFVPSILLYVFAIPVVILVLNYFFVIILKIRKSANTNDLYQTFHIFNRFIDKAVSTMPNYVDFEVLFTAKEIKRGIPVLNEYIEKRQLQEQEEMRKARENAVQHELYNFEEAGEKGELVLERAMKETDIFVNMRNRINTEIEQLEKEIDSLKRSFDNTTKDYMKKLQASKENSERLREQQEATTNRIENNYIRKQQADEIKKQQAIEKDQEDAQLRFNQEINNLSAEIKKRKDELEKAKLDVEKSMLSEYKTFSNKIYAEIRDSVNQKVKEERDELIGSREQVAKELEEAMTKVDVLEMQNKILVNKADQREIYVRAEVEREKRQLQEQVLQLQGLLKEKDKQIQLISTDYSSKPIEKQEIKHKIKRQDNLGKQESVDAMKEVVLDEKDERFDESGNFKFENGTYIDTNGNLHDENGNVFDKDGQLIKGEIEIAHDVKEIPKDTQETYKALEEILNEEIAKLNKEEQVGEAEIPEPVLENQEVEEKPAIEETEEPPVVKEAEEKPVVEEKKPVSKRGRPRKEKVEKPAKKRGRPRKIEKSEKASEPPKKRGRPRKEVVELEQPAKKRGRPRKKENETQKPASRRGRPKKIDIDENLKIIEKRLKEQNELLKTQQKALDKAVKNVSSSDEN